ncbi:MAG: Fe-S cluster assembly protein SufD [Deltaproteobacteria bacterium]|nr:Fe-S cluster assembly protein SufD [Deltaproteobacteria bacterium]MBW2413951.1 Fe-S cluster assembly protein SufD [Deltaproteobacteria bacterium]
MSATDSLSSLARRRSGDLQGAGPPWLGAARARALELFTELGVPGTRDEAWRFTNLRDLDDLAFAPAGEGERDMDDAIARAHATAGAVGEGHRLVFIDGVFSAAASSVGGLPSGVTVDSVARVLERQPERVKALLGSTADQKRRAFTALNTALFEDGLFVEIRRGQQLSAPIHAVFVQSCGAAPTAVAPRNLISLQPDSQAVIVEHYVGCADCTALTAPVTEIRLERGARLHHVILQEQAETGYQLGEVAVYQEADSHFASHSLALGGRIARVDLTTVLTGEGAHAQLDGLYLGAGRQLLDHYTTIDHAVPHTTSDEHYKGVLGGRAHGVFHGRVIVRPDAQKIDARQSNRNLVLSDAARVNTKPQLEIYADDVKCSHGATIGRLDAEQLFYLRSRGIDADAARAMLTLAFANEIGARLPIDELGSYLTYQIRRWLPAVVEEKDR